MPVPHGRGGRGEVGPYLSQMWQMKALFYDSEIYDADPNLIYGVAYLFGVGGLLSGALVLLGGCCVVGEEELVWLRSVRGVGKSAFAGRTVCHANKWRTVEVDPPHSHRLIYCASK